MSIGKVTLVGAGPGDPKLITLKGMEALQNADVVVYDRLANIELLKHCRQDVETIDVGKKPHHHTMEQEEINQLLVNLAKDGKDVVRLKGGDPYVFGRGAEEGETLYRDHILFDVVPGITAGIGGLAYAGIPITYRDVATSLHLITGHRKDEDAELCYDALAALEGTLVFYMGVKNAKRIASGLLDAGKDEQTPLAFIENATHPSQKVTQFKLGEVLSADLSKIRPPALIVVGDVVEKKEPLRFFDRKPLFGKKVVVTRSRNQASRLSTQLSEQGAEVIETPTIEISKLPIEPEKWERLPDFTHLVFVSTNGVQIFMDSLFEQGDARKLSRYRIASIGGATSAELMKYGIVPDVEADRFIAEGLVEALKKELTANDRVLILRAKNGRKLLKKEIEMICPCEEWMIYESVCAPISPNRKEAVLNADILTFTCTSTVRNFFQALPDDRATLVQKTCYSIGPITSEALRKAGVQDIREASEYHIPGLVKRMLEDYTK